MARNGHFRKLQKKRLARAAEARAKEESIVEQTDAGEVNEGPIPDIAEVTEPLSVTEHFSREVMTENAPTVSVYTPLPEYMPLVRPESAIRLEPASVPKLDIPDIDLPEIEIPDIEISPLALPDDVMMSSPESMEQLAIKPFAEHIESPIEVVEHVSDIQNDNSSGISSKSFRFDEKYSLAGSEAEATVFAGLKSRGIKPYFKAATGFERGNFSAGIELRCKITDACEVRIEAQEVFKRDANGLPEIELNFRTNMAYDDSAQALLDNSRLTLTKYNLLGDEGTSGSVFLNAGKPGFKIEHDRILHEISDKSSVRFSSGAGISDIGGSNQFNGSAGVYYQTKLDSSNKHLDGLGIKLGYGAFVGENYAEKIGVDMGNGNEGSVEHGFIARFSKSF